jgi:diguanylate cyclase
LVIGAENFQSGVWSKQSLERLLRDGLPPTPRNYAVYYEYCSGRNFALSNACDQLVAEGKMSQQFCDEFYYKYILVDIEGDFVRDADRTFDNELKKVLGLIVASAKSTDQFGENLDSFSGELSRADSLGALRVSVEKIARETQNVAFQNEKLRKELSETSKQLSAVRDDYDRIHHEAQIDALTEIGNRKFFDREIVRTLSEASQQDSALVLLMVDIDHFKKFNDMHGHLVGDQVLRLVARTLVENLKGRDVIARYGGEEFVIILPDTRLNDAERVANHLRNSLATKKVTKRGSNEVLGTVTISIGVAEYVKGEDSDTLIARADEAMYEAKQTGRNRVMCARTRRV